MPTLSAKPWTSEQYLELRKFLGRAVTNYTPAPVPYFYTGSAIQTFTVDGVVTRETWESIAPTAAAATHAWTALDTIPPDVTALYIGATFGVITDGSGNADATVFVRPTGKNWSESGDSRAGVTLIHHLWRGAALSTSQRKSGVPRWVPVNANGAFQLYWTEGDGSGEDIAIALLGFAR